MFEFYDRMFDELLDMEMHCKLPSVKAVVFCKKKPFESFWESLDRVIEEIKKANFKELEEFSLNFLTASEEINTLTENQIHQLSAIDEEIEFWKRFSFFTTHGYFEEDRR